MPSEFYIEMLFEAGVRHKSPHASFGQSPRLPALAPKADPKAEMKALLPAQRLDKFQAACGDRSSDRLDRRARPRQSIAESRIVLGGRKGM
jgi:hypothetical protein